MGGLSRDILVLPVTAVVVASLQKQKCLKKNLKAPRPSELNAAVYTQYDFYQE